MKKLLSAFVGLVLSMSLMNSVQAKTIQVSALEDFQTSNHNQVWYLHSFEHAKLEED